MTVSKTIRDLPIPPLNGRIDGSVSRLDSHYEIDYGKEAVEEFIDSYLVVQEHIDPSLIRGNKRPPGVDKTMNAKEADPNANIFEIGEKIRKK